MDKESALTDASYAAGVKDVVDNMSWPSLVVDKPLPLPGRPKIGIIQPKERIQ